MNVAAIAAINNNFFMLLFFLMMIKKESDYSIFRPLITLSNTAIKAMTRSIWSKPPI
jgi:hypothetical protein